MRLFNARLVLSAVFALAVLPAYSQAESKQERFLNRCEKKIKFVGDVNTGNYLKRKNNFEFFLNKRAAQSKGFQKSGTLALAKGFSMSGTTPGRTRLMPLSGNGVRIDYTIKPKDPSNLNSVMLQLRLFEQKGNSSIFRGSLANVYRTGGKATTYAFGEGNFYIEINSRDVRWTVKVSPE